MSNQAAQHKAPLAARQRSWLQARSRFVWQEKLRWIAQQELWIVALVAPPLIFPEKSPRSLTYLSLLVLVMLWGLRLVAWSRLSQRTPFDFPVVAILLMLPVSLYASADLTTSFPKLTGILLGVAVFYAIVNTALTWWQVMRLTALLLLTAMGVAGLSLVGTQWSSAKFPLLSPIYSFIPHYNFNLTRTGAFHANQVGGTLILFLPLNMALLVAALWSSCQMTRLDKKQRGQLYQLMGISLLLGISLLFTGVVLLLTQSRSALLGLGATLGLLLAFWNKWTRVAATVVVGIGLVIAAWIGPAQVTQHLLSFAQQNFSSGSLSFTGRQEVWSRAIYMLQDFPFTGVGLGMFDRVAHLLYPFFLIGPEANVFHAHNVFLQVGVDLGLPGLVAYIAMITVGFAVTWRIYRKATSPFERATGIGVLGGLMAYHIYGLTDAMTLGAKPGVALWALLGLAAAVGRYVDQSTTCREKME